MRAILTYHSIDSSGSPISVGVESFASHVRWLASGRVSVTTVTELLSLPDSADAGPITVDDGFENLADVAVPLLVDHGLTATVFIVADHAGGTNEWGRAPEPDIPVLPLLDWAGIGRIAEQGICIGAHAQSHRRLSQLTRDELVEEIVGSGEIIERQIGRRAEGFAYPYGSVSDDAAALVRTTCEWGCTTELRMLRDNDDRGCLPRLDMYYFRKSAQLERWGSARFDYYLRFRSRARQLR